ncbi:MAG: DUF924 domain-containing protein [Rhizobiaceae bacterium]|nr:DUF924 domain-containing protein [Rhizobiaceae bacterium]MCV0405818.1 DUF924 domain-containing protein [Rhizobiaceae bacterium]
MGANWVDQVLDFWFRECTYEEWFGGGAELDEKIRERFETLCRDLLEKVPAEAEVDPRMALAAVIMFDQFPRNMYRGTAEAFIGDDMAMRLARNAVDRGFDADMSEDERKFLYMPFMHSERLSDQERGLDLFRRLGDEDSVKYAVEHRDIIQKFGRFPHRNRPLGRKSTSAERAFMIKHNGFGQ